MHPEKSESCSRFNAVLSNVAAQKIINLKDTRGGRVGH